MAGFEASIVELSWFGDQAVPLPLGGAFHARRLTIASSQVGSVAPSQRARWDTRRRMQLALRLLADPSLDVLITGESEFRDAAGGDGRRSRRRQATRSVIGCDTGLRPESLQTEPEVRLT